MLPAFSHFYGLQPWQVEMLTFDEIEEFRRQLPKPAKTKKTRR